MTSSVSLRKALRMTFFGTLAAASGVAASETRGPILFAAQNHLLHADPDKYVFDLDAQQVSSMVNPRVTEGRRVEFRTQKFKLLSQISLSTIFPKNQTNDWSILVFVNSFGTEYKAVLAPKNITLNLLDADHDQKIKALPKLVKDGLGIAVVDSKTNNRELLVIPDHLVDATLQLNAPSPKKSSIARPLPLIVKDYMKEGKNTLLLSADQTFNLKTDGGFEYLGMDLSMQGQGLLTYFFADTKGNLYSVGSGVMTKILIDGTKPSSPKIKIDLSRPGLPVLTDDSGRSYRYKNYPK